MENYLIGSFAVFLILAITLERNTWFNLVIKLTMVGMTIWAALLWLAQHGAVRL